MHSTATQPTPANPDTPLQIVPIGMACLALLATVLFLPQLADTFRVQSS